MEAIAVQAQELNSFKADNGKYGYKDQNGKVIIAPKYDIASYDFNEGLARVSLDNKFGFIDKTGKEVIPMQYNNALYFSEGVAAVQKDTTWIYIDKANNTVLTLPNYIYVSGISFFSQDLNFSEGLAPVRIGLIPYERDYNDVRKPEVRTRLIKELGLSANPTEEDKEQLSQHLKRQIEQSLSDPYRYSYIDKIGKLLFDPFKGYHTAKRFSEGMAAVGIYVYGHTYRTMDPKYTFGYIDKTGQLTVPLKYEEARPFSEGLAAVKLKELWGFVNKTGKEIVPPQIGWVGDFKNGYAIVAHGKIEPDQEFNAYTDDAVWGIIGKDGRAVVPVANYSVQLDPDGTVTTIATKDGLETKVHISAFKEFSKGLAASQKQQYDQAAKHFQQAADKGHGGAMGNLGMLHIMGAGVEKNLEKGIEWMKKGAEKNDLHSMLNLGLHYAQNQPQDFSEAFKWFKLASDNGYAQAMGHLALLYATGQGIAQNSDEAFKWLNKGIVMGDVHSMFNSGLLYFQGIPGYEKNGMLARQWFQKAEQAGHPQAKAALEELTKMGM